jgi:hypothetical protein
MSKSEEGNEKPPRHYSRIITEKLGFSDSIHAKVITKSDSIFSLATIIILALVSIFYVFVLVNLDALRALIEAEATVLGFFGLIAVYLLTSMDSRIDRLEQEKHECEVELRRATTKSLQDVKTTPSEIDALNAEDNNLRTQIERIQNKKKRAINGSSLIGVLLIISLVADIGLLGFQSQYSEAIQNLRYPYFQIAGFSAGIPLIMFFESVWSIFSLLRKMGKEPP